MKKVLSTIITVLLVVSLTACGSSPSSDIKKPSDEPANNPASAEPEPSKEQAPAKEQEAEISETVLVDEAGVKITAIETAELSFHIFESEGWETIVDTDTVSIDF